MVNRRQNQAALRVVVAERAGFDDDAQHPARGPVGRSERIARFDRAQSGQTGLERQLKVFRQGFPSRGRAVMHDAFGGLGVIANAVHAAAMPKNAPDRPGAWRFLGNRLAGARGRQRQPGIVQGLIGLGVFHGRGGHHGKRSRLPA